MAAESSTFSIGLFEVGDAKSCLYSWFCTSCALADSRNALDGSNFCFNVFCLHAIPYRWLVRSAYNIGDTTIGIEDLLTFCFCPCCATNQLYQTTKLRGNPSSDGGALYNTQIMRPISYWPSNDERFLYSVCCSCCAIGDLASTAYGMPWWMGCCFMNLPMARNTIRYQYRLKTTTDWSELREECIFPSLVFYCLGLCAQVTHTPIDILGKCFFKGVIISHLHEEITARNITNNNTNGTVKRYLMTNSLPSASVSYPTYASASMTREQNTDYETEIMNPVQVEMMMHQQPSSVLSRGDGYATIPVHEK